MSAWFRFLWVALLVAPLHAWSQPTYFETHFQAAVSEPGVYKHTQSIRLDPLRDDQGQLWLQGTFWTRVLSDNQPQHSPSRYVTAMFRVHESIRSGPNRFTWNIPGLGTLKQTASRSTLTIPTGASVAEQVYARSVYGPYVDVVYPLSEQRVPEPDLAHLYSWPLSHTYGPWTVSHPDDAFAVVNFYFLRPSQHEQTVLVQEIDHQGRVWEQVVLWNQEETLDGMVLYLQNYGIIRLPTPLEGVWEYHDTTSIVRPLDRKLSHYASTQIHCSYPLDIIGKKAPQSDEWTHFYTFSDGSTWESQQLYAYNLVPYWRVMRDEPEAWLLKRDQWQVSGENLAQVGFQAHTHGVVKPSWTHDDVIDSLANSPSPKHIKSHRQKLLTFQSGTPQSCKTGFRPPHQQGYFLPVTLDPYLLPIQYEWTQPTDAPDFFSITSHTFR